MMKTLLAILVGLLSVPRLNAGFASDDVFLTAVGRVTQFYTTVWITNLSSSSPVTFTFQFLKTGQANPTPQSFMDSLLPGETKVYENVIESRFGQTNANGAGRIQATGEVFVASRIYYQPVGTDLPD